MTKLHMKGKKVTGDQVQSNRDYLFVSKDSPEEFCLVGQFFIDDAKIGKLRPVFYNWQDLSVVKQVTKLYADDPDAFEIYEAVESIIRPGWQNLSVSDNRRYDEQPTPTPVKEETMNKLKQFLANPWGLGFAAVAALLLLMTAVIVFDFVIVEPGEEVVLVDRPYFFGDSGVRKETVTEGRKLVWFTTEPIAINIKPITLSIQFDDLSTSNNSFLDFTSSVKYQITDAALYVAMFGKSEMFEQNLQRPYENIVRGAIQKRTMEDLMSKAEIPEQVDREISEKLIAIIQANKIPVRLIDVSLGKAKPNADVLSEMERTAVQEQRNKTLIKAQIAEVTRKAEQRARAEADNAYRNEMGLNSEEFIALETAKLYSAACVKAANCILSSGQALVTPVK